MPLRREGRFQLFDPLFQRRDGVRFAAARHLQDDPLRQFVIIDAARHDLREHFIRDGIHPRAQFRIDRRVLTAGITDLAQDLALGVFDIPRDRRIHPLQRVGKSDALPRAGRPGRAVRPAAVGNIREKDAAPLFQLRDHGRDVRPLIPAVLARFRLSVALAQRVDLVHRGEDLAQLRKIFVRRAQFFLRRKLLSLFIRLRRHAFPPNGRTPPAAIDTFFYFTIFSRKSKCFARPFFDKCKNFLHPRDEKIKKIGKGSV